MSARSRTAAYFDGLAEAALADAAEARQLEAVCGHKQVLRHRHVQVCPVGVLHVCGAGFQVLGVVCSGLSRFNARTNEAMLVSLLPSRMSFQLCTAPYL